MEMKAINKSLPNHEAFYSIYYTKRVVCNLENRILNYFFVSLMLEFYTRHTKES